MKLAQRLDAMDRRAKNGAWTQATLRAIEARPGVLAAKLARALGDLAMSSSATSAS